MNDSRDAMWKSIQRMRFARVAVIDGDIACYHVASTCGIERINRWGEAVSTIHLQDARDELDAFIEDVRDVLLAKRVVMCFSDFRQKYWRKQIEPSYKANRSGRRKPVGYMRLAYYCLNRWPSLMVPNLEADDVMGLLGTGGFKHEFAPSDLEDVVLVSEDKDMLTIPGKHYKPSDPESWVFEIDKREAAHNHATQALCGDTADGFPGCPGVGKVKAAKIIAGSETPGELWTRVVDAFEANGLDRGEALTQARMARILRAGDYDQKKSKVNLWTFPRKDVVKWR